MRRIVPLLSLVLLCACQNTSLPARTPTQVMANRANSNQAAAQRAMFPDDEQMWQFDFKTNRVYYIDLVQRGAKGYTYRAFEGSFDPLRQGVTATRELSPEICHALSLAPDQQQLAMALKPDFDSQASLVIGQGASRKELLKLPGEIDALAWSPDSRKLAVLLDFWRGDDRISRLVVLDTASRTVLSEIEQLPAKLPGSGVGAIESPPAMASLAWAPDSRRLAYTSFQGGGADIAVLDLASGSRQILTRETDLEFQPHWSPDGQTLFYTRGAVFKASGKTDLQDPNISDPDPTPITTFGFTSRLYAMAADGSAQRPLTAEQPGIVGGFNSWRQREDAPAGVVAGGSLLFHARSLVKEPASGPMDMPSSSFRPQLTLLPAGGKPAVLTQHLYGVQFVAYDPAGKRIYFEKHESFTPPPGERLWSIKLDGSDQRQLRFSSF